MKRKLYYTIEKEVDDTGESLTGNKLITVYEMVNNAPKKFASIDTVNDRNSKSEIQEYLNDNGFGDESFEFILL
jgi:hypothetical protein